MCTFGLSGCGVKPRRPRGRRLYTTTQELQTCTFDPPALQTIFHEKTPRERQKERKWERERENKARNLGLPTLRGPHPSGPPPFGPPTLLSPTFSGFGPHPPPTIRGRARPTLATTNIGQQLFLLWPRPTLATTYFGHGQANFGQGQTNFGHNL